MKDNEKPMNLNEERKLAADELEKVSGGAPHNGVIMVGSMKPPTPADCTYCDYTIMYGPEDIDADGYVTCPICKNKIKVK